MITIQMIRWFALWLIVFCVSLLLLSLVAAPGSTQTAYMAVAFSGPRLPSRWVGSLPTWPN